MAVQFNNSNAVGFTAATTAITPLRISGAPERYLIAMIALRSSGTPAVSAILYQPAGVISGQQSMTQLGVLQHPTQALRLEFWGLLAPSPNAGANARLNVTLSAMADGVVSAVAFTGVDQTTPYAGYPGAPTSLTGTGGSITTGSTVAANVPTAVGDMVMEASAWDMQTALETFISFAGQQFLGNVSSTNGTISSRVRSGMSFKTATTTNTAMRETIGNAAIALNYFVGGLALKASSDNAPRYVPNNATSLVSAGFLPQATMSVVTTTGFPAGTASPNSPSLITGAPTQAWGQTAGVAYYTGSTGTTFTGGSGGSNPLTLGAVVMEAGGYGQNLSSATCVVIVPSTALADDIAIVSFYTQDTATAVANAGWTSLTSIVQTASGPRPAFKHWVFYRRIQAADIVNEASRTFSFTCGAAVRNAVVSLYRGCIGAGTGNPGTAPAEQVSAFASSSSNTTYFVDTVTTTAPNEMVLSLFAFNVLSNTGKPSPISTDVNTERMAYTNLAVTDNVQLAAGAVALRHWLGATADATGITFALKPASGGATVARHAVQTNSAVTTTVSRAASTWRKTLAVVGAMTATVSRVGAFKRTLSRTTATISSTASRSTTLRRHATRTTASISSTVRRVGSSWKRNAAQTNFQIALVLHRNTIGIHYVRSLAVTLSAGTVATLSRAGSTWRRHATRTTTVISSIASRTLNAGPVTYIRNAVRTTAAISIVVTRPGSVWRRSLSRTTTSISSTVRRVGSAWKRTASRTTTTISSIAHRSATLRRHASRTTTAISSTVSRAGSTLRRHASRTTTAFLAVASRTTTSGPQFFIRNAVRLTTTISSTVSRRSSTWRRAATRTTTAITSVVSRRSVFNRNATRTTISLSSVVSRRAGYKRTLRRDTTSITIVVSRTVNGVSISFFPFGTMPILRLFTSADFVGANVYFEANIKSSVTGQAGFARLFDVTTTSAVPLSQVTTTAPHDTAQRVRSAAITLLNNHTYRAELGHNVGYTCSMSSADIVVELP